MSEKLAGQPAEFDTSATLIEAPGETTIDDEFAKTLGLDCLNKLKEAARERLVAEFAGATRQRVLKRAPPTVNTRATNSRCRRRRSKKSL